MSLKDLLKELGLPEYPERKVHYEPALSIDIEDMLMASMQPPLRIGDIVSLRTYVPDDTYAVVKKGERLIVTQAFQVKHDLSRSTTASGAKPVDMAIAVRVNSTCQCGDPTCSNKNVDEILEFLVDSRHFIKVSRIEAEFLAK